MDWIGYSVNDEDKLKAELLSMAGRAKSEANYNPTRFFEMLSANGAKETVRYLLSTPKPSDGYTNMVLAGRMDLTVEWLVQDEPWKSFLSVNELKTAQARTGPRKVT